MVSNNTPEFKVEILGFDPNFKDADSARLSFTIKINDILEWPAYVNIIINASGGWLCGTNILKDFALEVYLATKRIPETDVETFKKTIPNDLAEVRTDAWVQNRYYIQLRRVDKIQELAQEQLYNRRAEIFERIFPYFCARVSADNTAILMGGRITSYSYDTGRVRTIRTPELVEWLINSKKGVISATHLHNNKNYQQRDGESHGFSAQQFYLWTYQPKDSKNLPQVVEAGPEYCGTYYGEWEGPEELRKHFLDKWTKHLGVEADDKMLTPRTKPKVKGVQRKSKTIRKNKLSKDFLSIAGGEVSQELSQKKVV